MSGWVPAAALHIEVLDDEAVILSAIDGRIHRLNAVATRFWAEFVAGRVPEGDTSPDADERAEFAEFFTAIVGAGLAVRDDSSRP